MTGLYLYSDLYIVDNYCRNWHDTIKKMLVSSLTNIFHTLNYLSGSTSFGCYAKELF